MSMRARTVTAALLALAALPASAITNEPTAFGAAKLGAGTAEVKKAYPKMEPTKEFLGAQAFESEHLTRYVLKRIRVPETGQQGMVELRFWKDRLWAVIVYYGETNDQKVVETFTKRLGPPNGTNPQKPSWQGDKSLTFVETDQNWYSFTENDLSKDAQAWFFARLQEMKGAIAAQAAAAAATPAAKAAESAPAANPAAPAPAAPPATSAPAANPAK
jgi:hypothetical protein